MSLDYAPAAIEERLRRLAAQTDLREAVRLHAKIDYGPRAIEGRLREVEALRRACLALAKATRA